jgi:hypothetical protein
MELGADVNRRRASLEGGTVRMLEPAVYHGNPLSPRGVLVFTDFGWEVVDQLRACGFAEPTVNLYWGYELGYLGRQFYFDAAKP